MKNSRLDPEMAFQSAKVYISCLHTNLISSYDKFQLVRSSSLYKRVFAIHVFIKLDKLQYCAVIKFFILDGLPPKEIHLKLIRVHRNSASSISTVE